MARPKKGYYNAAGKRLPGVTTIIGARKNNVEGLLHWAHRLGTEGVDFKEARKKAANSGTLVHEMVEKYIDGDPIITLEKALAHNYTEEQYEQALVGFAAAKKWLSQTKIEITEQETPLVCEEFQFGGAFDAVGRLPDAFVHEFVMLDWKTGKLYPDHIIQVAAYKHLWEKANPGSEITEIHLCHFGKEFGEFGHSCFPQKVIDIGWEAFTHLLAMYQIDKQLKKVA